MNTIPKNPDEIVAYLSKVCSLIYDGLIGGSNKAREYFDILAHDFNRPLAANIIRYHTKYRVKEKRPFNAPYLIEEVPNNGLAILQGLFRIKVLKGKDGEAPATPKAIRSQLFYKQRLPEQQYLQGINWNAFTESCDWPEFAASISSLNLILCWESDELYNINQVQLMCPRKEAKYGEKVKLFWKRTVPHPVLGIIADTTVNDEDIDDLEVSFEDTGEAGPND